MVHVLLSNSVLHGSVLRTLHVVMVGPKPNFVSNVQSAVVGVVHFEMSTTTLEVNYLLSKLILVH